MNFQLVTILPQLSKTCQAISSSFLRLHAALVLSIVIAFNPDSLTIHEQKEHLYVKSDHRNKFSNLSN